MICVCHRCGIDLLPLTPAASVGPLQQQNVCQFCKGHYCSACFVAHVRENWCGQKGQLRLRQPAA